MTFDPAVARVTCPTICMQLFLCSAAGGKWQVAAGGWQLAVGSWQVPSAIAFMSSSKDTHCRNARPHADITYSQTDMNTHMFLFACVCVCVGVLICINMANS